MKRPDDEELEEEPTRVDVEVPSEIRDAAADALARSSLFAAVPSPAAVPRRADATVGYTEQAPLPAERTVADGEGERVDETIGYAQQAPVRKPRHKATLVGGMGAPAPQRSRTLRPPGLTPADTGEIPRRQSTLSGAGAPAEPPAPARIRGPRPGASATPSRRRSPSAPPPLRESRPEGRPPSVPPRPPRGHTPDPESLAPRRSSAPPPPPREEEPYDEPETVPGASPFRMDEPPPAPAPVAPAFGGVPVAPMGGEPSPGMPVAAEVAVVDPFAPPSDAFAPAPSGFGPPSDPFAPPPAVAPGEVMATGGGAAPSRRTLILVLGGGLGVAVLLGVLLWAVWPDEDEPLASADGDPAEAVEGIGTGADGEPEAGEPEAGEPGAREPEAGEPEAGEPEAGEPEAGEPAPAPAGSFVIVDEPIPENVQRMRRLRRRQRAQRQRRLASRLHVRRRYDRAETWWRRAIVYDPESAESAAGLARTLSALDRDAEAFAWARRAVENGPRNTRARLTLGDLLRDAGDVAGAIEQYEAGLRARPRDRRLQIRLSRLRSPEG